MGNLNIWGCGKGFWNYLSQCECYLATIPMESQLKFCNPQNISEESQDFSFLLNNLSSWRLALEHNNNNEENIKWLDTARPASRLWTLFTYLMEEHTSDGL